MSSDESLQSVPTAIPFREFRDEEIADFFANGDRPFRPSVDENFGRQRLVGAAHSPMTRKPTAAFRTALAAKQNKGPKPKSVLCGSVPKTIPMLPGETKAVKQNVAPPFGKPAKPLGTLARKPVAPHGRGAHIVVDPVALPSSKSREVTSPCTSYPGIPLDNGLQNLTEKPVPPVDAELVKLVSSWPRLSTSLKEIISTLIGSESAAG